MGDPEGWPQPSGLLPEGSSALFPCLDDERWLRAEERTLELITRIQPTKSSEERRRAVSDYVQRLIRKCIDCEVFTFGSVPLKTYLPDGDIDLTAFSRNPHWKDTWANEVRGALEAEEHSQEAEFRVKEVQYIQAEVKIIKCLVENIVVDISFNQLGGLCTLCFLEEVDRLIGRDHLFKRSILLVKAWCYYESRILGAHHGLISTYALETLVLYIFHVFHASLRGPLGVLFRFLEFFSNFDWDKYCVSLWGPVPLTGHSDMAELPRKDGGKLLLSKVFLDQCARVYAVSPGINDVQSRAFSSKYLNVIDPLKVTNNLGRSVSKGNFFRIRSAFSYGARKLARILECHSMDSVVEELDKFFMNTWDRHGSGKRPDAPDPIERLPSPTSEGPASDDESESPKRAMTPKKKREQPSRLSGEIPVFAVEHGRMNDFVQKPSPNAAGRKSHQGEVEAELAAAPAEPFMDREGFEARSYRDNGPGDEAHDVAADVRVPRESLQKLSLSPGAKLPPPSLWGNASPLDVPSFFPRAPAVLMNHVEEASAEVGAEDMPPTQNLVAWDSMAKGNNLHLDHQHQVPVLAGPPPPPPPTSLDPAAASVLHPRKGRPVENHSVPAYYYAGVPFYVPYSYPVYLLPPEAAGGDSFGDFLPLPTSEDGTPMICGVGDRLSAAGIPVSAGQRVEAEPDTRFDHLSSDFVSHLRNLDYGRACQQPSFFVPVFPFGKEHHMWEGSGRLGMKQVGHGRGRGYHRSYNADEAAKGRAGTGTYIPAGSNNRQRDRQFRGHHEVYQERSEYDVSPRYARYGRGSNRITQKSDKGWHEGGYNRSSMPPVAFSAAAAAAAAAGNSAGNVLSPPPPVNLDVYSQVYMNGNGNSAAPAGPLLVVYPYGNPNEALEFGTLGPVQGSSSSVGGSSSSSSRTSSDRQQQQQQQQQVLLQQQQHQQQLQLQQQVQGGTDLHQSCVLPSGSSFRPPPELTYQMKEEDFPPLSFRGTGGGGGSSPSGGGGGGGGSKSSYQTYVASQS